MADNTLTHIAFLLDRSGSMGSIKREIEGGFSTFIDEQKKSEGACTVTLAQFDTVYEKVYESVDVEKVPEFHLHPRGLTALLDSMGTLINETKATLKKMPKDKRPGTVIIAIMTDGLENSSHEWTRPEIRKLVEKQTGKGWQFLYMGANQDAVEVGTGLGISQDHAITYSPTNSGLVMNTTSQMIASLRSARIADPASVMAAYTSDQRTATITD